MAKTQTTEITLSSKLRDLRTVAGLSQAAAAKGIGATQSVYSKWETGAQRPNLEHLLRIADFYGVDRDEMIELYRSAA